MGERTAEGKQADSQWTGWNGTNSVSPFSLHFGIFPSNFVPNADCREKKDETMKKRGRTCGRQNVCVREKEEDGQIGATAGGSKHGHWHSWQHWHPGRECQCNEWVGLSIMREGIEWSPVHPFNSSILGKEEAQLNCKISKCHLIISYILAPRDNEKIL
jgi:hypothetical protein